MERLRSILVVAVFGMLACKSGEGRDGGTTSGGTALPRRSVAQDVEAVASGICKSATCTGRIASIQVFRDAGGAARVLYYSGDFERCSHPPSTYYDASGHERLSIPNHPVKRGEEAAIQAQHDSQTKGLIKAETVSCSDFL